MNDAAKKFEGDQAMTANDDVFDGTTFGLTEAEQDAANRDKAKKRLVQDDIIAAARQKKVNRLVMTLRAAVHLVDPRIRMEYLAKRVESFGDREWAMLELLTLEKRVSSATSRALVVAELQEAARDELEGQLQQRKGWEL